MQYELLKYLRCPLGRTELRLEVISEFNKAYKDGMVAEVCDGLLFSTTGMVFPVIAGIPRLNPESFYDYRDFLQAKLENYEEVYAAIHGNHREIMDRCAAKNRRTKESFAFEWSFLDAEKDDRIWHQDKMALRQVLITEVGEPEGYFVSKLVLDAGCGHGIMTSTIASISGMAIGVELGKAVERAYVRNRNAKAHYVQADLQFLPFEQGAFDLVYSSGVIHHTPDTRASLHLIGKLVRTGGKICLWLYHPRKNILHNMFLGARFLASKMPVRLTFLLLCVFVFPFSFVFKCLTRKDPPNAREEMIDLLDLFTPEFRDEVTHQQAQNWLDNEGFRDVSITSRNAFGFSITGKRVSGA